MKNVLIMICCACLLGACDKAEVSSIYSGPDGIHSYYDQAGPFDADPYPNSSETGSLSSSEKIYWKYLITFLTAFCRAKITTVSPACICTSPLAIMVSSPRNTPPTVASSGK